MKNTPLLALHKAAGMAVLAAALHGAASAQTPGQSLAAAARADHVAWSLAGPAGEGVKPGSRVALTLRGDVAAGWHVYAFKQLPLGPTPLVVKLDASEVAKADGAPVGSRPVKTHDPSFDLETQYYAEPFTVTVPVRLGAKLAPGRQQIPVSVSFQTCNGEICQPPKTVRLSATVNVRAEG